MSVREIENELNVHPDNNTVNRRMDIGYHKYREQREKYQVKVNEARSERLQDFIKTLDVDFYKFSILQRRKLDMNDYVFSYDISLIPELPAKTNLDWTLRKRRKEFEDFEKKLNHELMTDGKMEKQAIPQIADFFRPGYDKRRFDAKAYADATQTYLLKLLENKEIRAKSTVLYEFFEISLMPLPNGPMKYKEGPLEKRGGGRFKRNKLSLYCRNIFAGWQKRWFIITEEGVIYSLGCNGTKPRETMLFDQSFNIEYGHEATGTVGGINLLVPNRRLHLRADSIFETILWVDQIQRAAKACPYTKKNRFDSFAPVREPSNYSKWYVDGEGYFADLCKELMDAKKEVFITDWWLTPEIALTRPVQDDQSETRLDTVLGKIANRGVRVYVIVYHEVTMLMYNDSDHVKMQLESLSPNITVLKHPSEPFFSWSHHEKMVVIDQKVGFMGGIDLCFGRMDNSTHPINDPAFDKGEGHTFLGKDFSNSRIADFKNVREANTPQIDKKNTPRLPWHDAQIQVRGAIVADLSRHFIQYWNHVEVDCYSKQEGSEAPLPKHNVIPGAEEDPLKAHNATIKMKNAFNAILGQQKVLKALKTGQDETEQSLLGGSARGKDGPTRDTLGSTHQNSDPNRYERQENPQNKGNLQNNKDVQSNKQEHGTSQSRNSLDENVKEKNPNDEEKKEGETEKKDMYSVENPVDKDGGTGQYIDEDYKDSTWPVKVVHFGKNVTVSAGRWFLGLVGYYPSKEEIHVAGTFGKHIRTMGHVGHDQKELVKDKYKQVFEKNGEGDHKKGIRESLHDRKVRKQPKNVRWAIFANDDDDDDSDDEDNDDGGSNNYFRERNKQQIVSVKQEKLLDGTIQCQMLRSASKWSLGLDGTNGNKECSIQNAYCELIAASKNFIYIENQFFMSVTAGETLKNHVGQALVDRIVRAYEEKTKFRVLVFVPLLHSFEGDVDDPKAAVLRIQMHWQYSTISRGGSSIMESLRKRGIKAEDYIQFFSLRAHARMSDGNPATEEIYIHSKIMIVDDNIVLIGSANINDRSLEGDRDSELAMVLEDSKKIPSRLNGKETEASEFACTFRRALLAEHLGLTTEEVIDPLEDGFIKNMNEVVESNTKIYRDVFRCYPDDNVKKLDQIKAFQDQKNLELYGEVASKISGHAVWYPLDFLCEEKLSARLSSVEYYIPDETYV